MNIRNYSTHQLHPFPTLCSFPQYPQPPPPQGTRFVEEHIPVSAKWSSVLPGRFEVQTCNFLLEYLLISTFTYTEFSTESSHQWDVRRKEKHRPRAWKLELGQRLSVKWFRASSAWVCLQTSVRCQHAHTFWGRNWTTQQFVSVPLWGSCALMHFCFTSLGGGREIKTSHSYWLKMAVI